MVDPAITAAIVASIVSITFGSLVAGLRYIFGIQLATKNDVDKKIAGSEIGAEDKFNEIYTRLDKTGEKLEHIEELIMGSEYQVSEGMLEVVLMNRDYLEDHKDRIKRIEHIQIKIRRKQEDDGQQSDNSEKH